MNKEQLLEGVRANAAHLRNSLTPAQTAKLNYAELRPFKNNACLLGQIFGNSNSRKARQILPFEVLAKSKTIGFAEMISLNEVHNTLSFERFTILPLDSDEIRKESASTPIELFLMMPTNSEELFKYLKGEVDTFEPAFLEVPEVAETE